MQSSRDSGAPKHGIDADLKMNLLVPRVVEELRGFHTYINGEGFGRLAAVSPDWAGITEPTIVTMGTEIFDWLESSRFTDALVDAFNNLTVTLFLLDVAGTAYMRNMREIMQRNQSVHAARCIGVTEELTFKDKITIANAAKEQIKGCRCQYNLARRGLIHFFEINDKEGYDIAKTQLEALPDSDYCTDSSCEICKRTRELVEPDDMDSLFRRMIDRLSGGAGARPGPSPSSMFSGLPPGLLSGDLPPGMSIRQVEISDASEDALRSSMRSCGDQDCPSCREIQEELDRRGNSNNPNANQPN